MTRPVITTTSFNIQHTSSSISNGSPHRMEGSDKRFDSFFAAPWEPGVDTPRFLLATHWKKCPGDTRTKLG